MLTHTFELFIICLTCFAFILLISAGMYCRYRSRSYIGTGRVNEIETWYTRATLAWVCTFCLSVALVIKFI
ncbi:MAG: hypothetical protein V4456_01705 [Bacteroidota bacterium]